MELMREPSWMDPIIIYLKNGELPKEKMEAHILPLKAARYLLYDDKLYKRGYSMPLLKCVLPKEAKNIMWEIHEGTCGNHSGGQSWVFKALRPDYNWPIMKTDCMEYAQKWDKCQRFSLMSKSHPKELISMTSPWSFIIWGIDLISRLPKRKRQRTVCYSSYRLLYQVSRGKSRSIHHTR